MRPMKNREIGTQCDAEADEKAWVPVQEGDNTSPETADAVAAAIAFMEEYAEVFEELAK